jgi:hypothetical protein
MKIFNRLFYSLALIIFVAGFFLPIDSYITPKNGVGFILGIVGASMMLISILGYSIPRRLKLFKKAETFKWFFNFHRMLGVAGPICILYHCGYHLGSPNSNMAVYSMIAVVTAGLITMLLYFIPKIDKYTKWWKSVHLPMSGLLVVTALIHITSIFFY